MTTNAPAAVTENDLVEGTRLLAPRNMTTFADELIMKGRVYAITLADRGVYELRCETTGNRIIGATVPTLLNNDFTIAA